MKPYLTWWLCSRDQSSLSYQCEGILRPGLVRGLLTASPAADILSLNRHNKATVHVGETLILWRVWFGVLKDKSSLSPGLYVWHLVPPLSCDRPLI